jgi:hypothetical protein
LAADEKRAVAGEPVPVGFLGVWDTVLSEGLPDKDRATRAPGDLGEAEGIGAGVGRVVHLLSIDDPRKVFTPTLFAPDERVTEVWFAGVHSDVGGGYRVAGLSDLALEFMLDRASAEAGLRFAGAADLAAYAATDGSVEGDDLASNPNPGAEDHVTNFSKFYKEAADAVGPRNVMTLGGGPPVLHPSVIERGLTLPSYRPKNLRNLRHTIWGSPGTEHESFLSHFSNS